MVRDLHLFAKDIVDNITRVENYIKNYTYEQFVNDNKTTDAVERCL